MEMTKPTNAQFSQTDAVFLKACFLAGTPPTKRQASKYRRKIGKAYRMKAAAVAEIKQEGK